MKTQILMALGAVFVLLLAAGCAAQQNNTPQAAPVLSNPPGTPPSTPSVVMYSNLSLDPQKALVITVLTQGQNLSFDNMRLGLQSVSVVTNPTATFGMYNSNGNLLQNFSIPPNTVAGFTAPGGEQYYVVTLFNAGGAMPNQLQIQVYRAQDLNVPSSSLHALQPENSYTLGQEYPAPTLLANNTLYVGQSIAVSGVLSAGLVSINSNTNPISASLRILDGSGQLFGTTALQGGQMVAVNFDPKNRYAVVMSRIDNPNNQVLVAIYQEQVFQNATYNISDANGGA